MYICQKCNYSSESPANFCPLCGGQMVEAEAKTLQPDYIYPAPTQKPSLAKKIVGMALSIEGFIGAIVTAIYNFILLIATLGSGEAIVGAATIAFTFIMALIVLPFAIIGLVFSKNARNLGDTSIFSRLGKIFGIAAIIIIAVAFVLAVSATTTTV